MYMQSDIYSSYPQLQPPPSPVVKRSCKQPKEPPRPRISETNPAGSRQGGPLSPSAKMNAAAQPGTFGLRDWRTSLAAAAAPSPYGAVGSNSPAPSLLARLASVLAYLVGLVVALVSFVFKSYFRLLRWALARPTLFQRCTLVSLMLALGFVLLSLAAAQVLRLMAADPCVVMRASEERLAAEVGDAPLPKIIHQQWKTTELPEGEFTKWHNEMKRLFPPPEYKHVLWTDVKMRAFIEEKFPWFLSAYDNYAFNVQRADAVRYFILYTYGGLYADLDYEPLSNFWAFLPSNKPAFIESPYKYNEQVQNSLMSSPPGHLFWNSTFQLLLERASQRSILTSTGPKFVDAAISLAKQGPLGPDPVYVLPCENFHRIPIGEAGKIAPGLATLLREIMARSFLVKQCGAVDNPQCMFGIHHNAVSWSSSSNLNKGNTGWFSWW